MRGVRVSQVVEPNAGEGLVVRNESDPFLPDAVRLESEPSGCATTKSSSESRRPNLSSS